MYDYITLVAQAAGTAIITALALIVAFKLVSGRISLRGLWTDKEGGKRSPARMQATLVTLLIAAVTFGGILNGALLSPNAEGSFLLRLPFGDSSDWIITALLGGSHSAFLGAKAASTIEPLRRFLRR